MIWSMERRVRQPIRLSIQSHHPTLLSGIEFGVGRWQLVLARYVLVTKAKRTKRPWLYAESRNLAVKVENLQNQCRFSNSVSSTDGLNCGYSNCLSCHRRVPVYSKYAAEASCGMLGMGIHDPVVDGSLS